MNWNESAKVGAKLQNAFWNHNYDVDEQLIDAAFVFDILDKIHLEDGYSLKIKTASNLGLGDVSELVVVPTENGVDPIDMHWDAGDNLENLIIVEPTEMGVFQAMLLKISNSWMPFFGHGGYNRRKYIFSDKNLQSLEGKSSWGGSGVFRVKDYASDERLNPKVEINGEDVNILCCYWSEWGGLIRTSLYYKLHNNHLISVAINENEDNSTRREVLFKYNCGILF